jgi:hypothetical protein
MKFLLPEIFPFLYALSFLLLIWQAFRVMGQGFRAARSDGKGGTAAEAGVGTSDRTGQLTVHPELLDADGQLTREDLLTVRFSGDNEQPASSGDPA